MSYGHYCATQSNVRTWRTRLRSWLRTYLPLKCINDKLQGLRLHALDALLHHVVTVLVFHTLQDMAVQLPYHLVLLEGEKDKQKAPPGLTADKCSFHCYTRYRNTKGMKDALMYFSYLSEVFQWLRAEMKPAVLQKPSRKILLQEDETLFINFKRTPMCKYKI